MGNGLTGCESLGGRDWALTSHRGLAEVTPTSYRVNEWETLRALEEHIDVSFSSLQPLGEVEGCQFQGTKTPHSPEWLFYSWLEGEKSKAADRLGINTYLCMCWAAF